MMEIIGFDYLFIKLSNVDLFLYILARVTIWNNYGDVQGELLMIGS